MKQEYQSLAASIENTTFAYQDYKVKDDCGTILPISHYYLTTTYKDLIITIENELGNHSLGKVQLDIKGYQLPDFKITTRNHFINLFSRKKEMLKIECRNPSFRHFLYSIVNSSGLEKTAKKHSFQPTISLSKNRLCIQTIYHLQFEDKTAAVKALIDFHKKLIDYLK